MPTSHLESAAFTCPSHNLGMPVPQEPKQSLKADLRQLKSKLSLGRSADKAYQSSPSSSKAFKQDDNSSISSTSASSTIREKQTARDDWAAKPAQTRPTKEPMSSKLSASLLDIMATKSDYTAMVYASR